MRAWSGGEREEFIPAENISKQDWEKKKKIGETSKERAGKIKKKQGRKKARTKSLKNKYLQYYSPLSTVRNPPPTPRESDPNSDN